jgi:hypothetical protein
MREPRATAMKRRTVILPLTLPVLTDNAAVQLLELLHELVAVVEHHYAAQTLRHRRRQRERRYRVEPQPSRLLDTDEPPF